MTNVKGMLADQSMSVEDFRLEILKSIFGGLDQVKYYELTDEDWAAIHKISEERYQKWEWNYGKSPKFNIQRSKKFASGFIDLRLTVNKGTMQDVHIFGDFFGIGDMKDIEEALIGKRYEKQVIEEALAHLDIPRYFGGTTLADFIDLMY